MNTSKIFLTVALVVLFVSAIVWAEVEIPVVVNVLSGVTFSQGDAEKMVENMNKNLKPGGVKFVLKDVNDNVKIGNGDGDLDIKERNEAREKGRGDLKEKCGGKGIKIYICNLPNAADPSKVGWACHKDNVIFVKPNSDPNLTGDGASHEATHALTVKGHSTDQNDLMYGDINGGTNLRPEDINEIKARAPKVGTVITKTPSDSKTSGKAKNDGVQKNVRAVGRVLDNFEDAIVTAGDPYLFNPSDPNYRYIDIEHILLICDNPTAAGAVVNVEIFPGGMFPDFFYVDSFFDVYFEPNKMSVPEPNSILQIHIWRFSPGPLMAEAKMLNELGNPIATLTPPEIIRNEILDWESVPQLYNDVIECQVPLHLIVSEPEPLISNINIHSTSRLMEDERILGVQAIDETDNFSFDLENPAGPSIRVTPAATFVAESSHWVFGSGFIPGETVTVMMTSEADIQQFAPVRDTVTADADGNFRLVMSPEIAGGLETYSIVAVGEVTVNNNIRSALGFFTDYPLPPDLDNDKDVDFLDFAIFANYWLDGK